MNQSDRTFLALVAVSVANVMAAYVFGNDGYEAFISVAVSLVVLMTVFSAKLVALLWRGKNWAVVKAAASVLLVFFWFVALVVVMLSIQPSAHNPRITTIPVNWIVVLAGALAYVLPRIAQGPNHANRQELIVQFTTTVYSIMVIFLAIIGFYDQQATHGGILLVLAVQLQYLMSYVVTRTGYLLVSHTSISAVTSKLHIENTRLGVYLYLLVVGLPFFAPLAIVLLVWGMR